MNTNQEVFQNAPPSLYNLNISSELKLTNRSYKLECITPDKHSRVEDIISGTPNYESKLYNVWKNKYYDNYFVLNKITGDLYLIFGQDINECMEGIQSYYTKLSVEIFEALIKNNFNVENTILELTSEI